MNITAFTSYHKGQLSTSTAANGRRPLKIATSMGMLEFLAGIPTHDTLRMIHDNLLLARAVEVFLKTASAVSLYRLREAQQHFVQRQTRQPRIFFKANASKLVGGVPRISKYNAWSFIDLITSGPTVVELPRNMVGVVNDMWFRVVEDIGMTGRDSGQGGKYLILPPDHRGDIPRGYFILRPRTNSVGVFVRPTVARLSSCFMKFRAGELKIYPLFPRKESSLDRSESELIDGSLLAIKELTPYDDRFFADLNQLLQKEPFGSLDKEKRALFASIGLMKGKLFRPTIRMQKMLGDAVAIGHVTLHVMARNPQLFCANRIPVDTRGVVNRNNRPCLIEGGEK
jgi:hypothetical protein